MRNIRSRLATGSLWISGARGVGTLLTFVTTIVLARILVPSDFGLIALASTMLAVLTSVTNLSVASALIHLKNATEGHYHTAWTLGLLRGAFLAAIFCLIGWPASYLYSEPRLDNVMYALSISVFVAGLTNPRVIMLKKNLVFWQVFVLQVANNLVAAIVSVGWALVYDDYWALVLGTVSGQITSTGLSYVLLPFRPRLSLKHLRDIFSFSMWLTLGQAVTSLNFRLDQLLIGGFLGRAALGYYSVGTNLAASPSRESVLPLTQTLYPAFSMVSDDVERLRRAYQRAQSVVTAIALPAGIGFVLIADPFVRLAMGDKWAPAIIVIQMIGSIYAFVTLGSLSTPLAMATGATRLLFIRSLQLLLLRLPFIMTGMYLWGLLGLLYARVFVAAVGIIINLRLVQSLTGLSIPTQLRANMRSIVAAGAMVGAVVALQQALSPSVSNLSLAIMIIFSILVGAASYITASLLLWLAAGRPPGPEQEAIELSRNLVGRVLGRYRSASGRDQGIL